MNKLEFEQQLADALVKAHVPQAEVERAVAFFDESIEDRMEEGMSEEMAVYGMGSVNDVALQVIQDLPAVPKAVATASANSNTTTKVLAIILAIVLIPLWLPIAAGILATVISLYVASWAIILSLWAAAVCMVLAPAAGIVFTVMCGSAAPPQLAVGFLSLGASLVCCALGLLLFLGILYVTKEWAILTGRFFKWVKSLFVKDRTAEAAAGADAGAYVGAGTYAGADAPTNPMMEGDEA